MPPIPGNHDIGEILARYGDDFSFVDYSFDPMSNPRTVICPYDPLRFVLVFATSVSNGYVIKPSEATLVADGQVISNGGVPFVLNARSHPLLVNLSWSLIGSPLNKVCCWAIRAK